jgi:hypothetical protein
MSSKMNLLVHLNAYQDANASNNPTQNNWKWQRDIQGINIEEPASKSLNLPAGQSVELFSGAVDTDADNTTTWNIALKAGTSQTYVISKASGTSPAFRTARVSGADATTQITVTKNASLLTFTSTGGTALNLIVGGVVVGDDVRLGSLFNAVNRGKFKVLARTATSFTIENPSGQAEGPITLGAGFADQLSIFSADGVQVGDKVDIVAGFSSVSFGTYEITDASPDYIEIYSLEALPTESGVSNSPSAFLIYRDAKSFVYIESNQKLEITIDGSSVPNSLEPMRAGTSAVPGVFMSSASMKSLEITNKSMETATIFYVTAE